MDGRGGQGILKHAIEFCDEIRDMGCGCFGFDDRHVFQCESRMWMAMAMTEMVSSKIETSRKLSRDNTESLAFWSMMAYYKLL